MEYWIKNQRIRYRASFAGFFPADDPKYTCIVIVHKPDNNKGIYGGSVTGPVFKKIADWVYSRTPKPTPNLPLLVDVNKSIVSDPVFKANFETSKMPNVVGNSGRNVIPALENMGLDVQYSGFGRVISQSIPAGMGFKKGQTIYLDLES